MKVLIIGAGRMGIRHAQGVQEVSLVSSAEIVDINTAALDNARGQLKDPRFTFSLLEELPTLNKGPFDVCIIAATAGDRIGLLKLAKLLQCKNILIEKPLGQSIDQVKQLISFIEDNKLNCAVNLNMRLYKSFIELKDDLQMLPQLKGDKTITVNTGTLGIGANGIHYLDLLYFLLDADTAKLVAAEVDETVIPSGRGQQFGDFGGWAVIKFYKEQEFVGKALVSMSSTSTVFGSWEIVAPHGRIYFNEVEGKRIDTLRRADSQMPVNRYFADYNSPVQSSIESPFLGKLTAQWIEELSQGKDLLPKVAESLKVHELMFEWLNKSKTHKEIFPIT